MKWKCIDKRTREVLDVIDAGDRSSAEREAAAKHGAYIDVAPGIEGKAPAQCQTEDRRYMTEKKERTRLRKFDYANASEHDFAVVLIDYFKSPEFRSLGEDVGLFHVAEALRLFGEAKVARAAPVSTETQRRMREGLASMLSKINSLIRDVDRVEQEMLNEAEKKALPSRPVEENQDEPAG